MCLGTLAQVSNTGPADLVRLSVRNLLASLKHVANAVHQLRPCTV